MRLVLLAALALTAGAETLPMPLSEAAARVAPGYAPKHAGERVRILGTVQAPAQQVVGYSHLAVRDEDGYGLILEAGLDRTASFLPGDQIEAEGIIGQRGGLPVLLADQIRLTGKGDLPTPKPLAAGDLYGFRWLGRWVVAEGRVIGTGDNAGGDYVVIGERDKPVKVFLPRTSRSGPSSFAWLSAGDKVRVRGIASQYASIPPYNHSFQVLIARTGDVQLLERAWLVPPQMVLVSLVSMFLAVGVWWHRERRLAAQRRALLALNVLSERIIAAGSSAGIQEMLTEALPGILHCTTARIYLYRRGRNVLERLPLPNESSPLAVPVDTPVGEASSGAALCFRNRTLLAVPDTRRTPFFADSTPGRSLLFVPMFAQSEIAGVLEIVRADQKRAFAPEQHAAAQHLANQIAASLRLIQQQSMREQLYRSEKLAAIGQLVSGIASELSEPLESIRVRTSLPTARGPRDIAERDMHVIASEAKRASEIVKRLLGFARAESPEAKPLDLGELLAGLAEFRQHEWAAKGIESRVLIPDSPVWVLGSRKQIEQVFLNLFMHAEQSLSGSAGRTLSFRLTLLARRALVEIGCPSEGGCFGQGAGEDENQDGLYGLGVCRGIVQGHGGEIRVTHGPGSFARIEVEFPISSPPEGQGAHPERKISVLLVEPDAATHRRLLFLLGGRGHRVVPAAGAEEALELAGRFRFEAVFCSAVLPGSGWPVLADSLRGMAGTFVLVGLPGQSSLPGAPSTPLSLAKPIAEADLDRVLLALNATAVSAGA